MNKKQYKRKLVYTRSYNKENYKTVSFRLSYEKEQDIIDWLNNFGSNKAYMLMLIKKDMKRNKVK